jgi:hypothetical protein
MASTYLTRTPSNNYYTEATFSFWVKRSGLSSDIGLFGRKGTNQTAYGTFCHFSTDDALLINFRDSSGTSQYYMITNRKFRDTSAWYHIHLIIDGDNATQGDRSRLYINGVRETDFSLLNNPSSTGFAISTFLTTGEDLTVGRSLRSQTNTFHNLDGSMSHFHCVTGTAYEPTEFGEFDANGVWKIKTSPSVTYGTNGFFILKDSASVTDQSGNGNNFTVAGGTLTNTEDNPSNVFATFNPLYLSLPTGGLSNGNTKAETNGGDSTWRSAFGNLGATSGKYYMEVKWVSGSHFVSGFASQKTLSSHNFKDLTDVYSGGQYFGIYGTQLYTNGSASGSYTTQASGNIIQLALDMDNKKIYQGINGTWNVGGNPSSGNGISITGDTDEFWTFGISTYSNSGTGEYYANFGNGYFGTTAVASAGTNASGNGIFEYDVPTGYTALSTKGLNL